MQGMGEEHGEDGMALREGGVASPRHQPSGPSLASAPGPGCFSAGLTVSLTPARSAGSLRTALPPLPPNPGPGP